MRYPPHIGEQRGEFTLSSFEAYEREIASARTFGFMKDLKIDERARLGTGGRLDNCTLVGDEGVANTTLRFPDEFVSSEGGGPFPPAMRNRAAPPRPSPACGSPSRH